MRRLQRTIVAVGLAVGFFVTGVGVAVPASAHARVVATLPAQGAIVRIPLTRVSVWFDEPVTLLPHALGVTTDLGIPVTLETPRLIHGTLLTAALQDRLAPGRYAVAWRVQADDGHIESDSFTFVVASAGAQAPTTSAGPAQLPPAPAPAPGEPIWPVLVAAGIAVAGGLAAGVAVRRGLRLAGLGAAAASRDSASPPERETFRLPM
jgi:copper transport protein